MIDPPIGRERAVGAAGLVGTTALIGAYLARASDSMADVVMRTTMPDIREWGGGEAVVLLVMWMIVTVALMTPPAAPMALTFAAIARQRQPGAPRALTGAFVLGYLATWSLGAAVAAMGQLGLHNAALRVEAMTSTSPLLGGALLLTAGAFQWTPLRHAVPAASRSPLSVLMERWPETAAGAWVLGVRQGVRGVGGCWVLMALLFVAGVMNLAWTAAIAAIVLAEKALPWGEIVGRVAGVVFVGGGLLLIAGLWLM